MQRKVIRAALIATSLLCLSQQKVQAQTITIGDRVWYDVNRDGRQDSGEPGVSNVTVKLFADANGDNVADNATPTATATTDANGMYAFNNVTAGMYFVQFPIPVPAGYTGYTTQGAAGVPQDQWSACNVNTGKTGTHNFTATYLYKDAGLLKNAEISGTVYDDNNAGTPDGTVFPNVGVTLQKDGVYASANTTDASGNYTFSNLVPGNYTVVLSVGGGYNNVGSTDATPLDGSTNVTVGNSNVSGVNFGLNYKPTATNDNLNNQTPGTVATVSNILSNDSDPNGGTLSKDSLSLVAPSGATGITTDAQGDVTGFTVPNQGTWALNSSTGAVTFTPQSGFTANPTPINYTVTDNAKLTSNAATITVDYNTLVTLSGTVYNDINGGTIDGIPTNAINALNALLVNGAGNVVATVPVNTSGQYKFTNVTPGDYSIILSTTAGTVGQAAPAASLPSGWANTAEGITTAGDGTANGSFAITISSTSISNADFGIEQLPTPTSNTAAAQHNPGGTNSATVPATEFGGTDPDGGTLTSLRIITFPFGITSITINNVTYTAANFPADGVSIPTNAQGQPTQNIAVDPSSAGPSKVRIRFKITDNAGKESSDAAILDLPFLGIIKGNVFNDVDAMNGNDMVDGSGINKPSGQQLYAYLLNSAGLIIDTATVTATGSFTFNKAAENTTYTAVISTTNAAIGSSNPSVALPSNWVNTGEQVGGVTGN
ncbi:hypothetical protein DBR32_14090, partial [Taibaiella sp. KBW10]|uniref:SdrD B-like domain-containing protein n=1 Tax=Taibaiella sp. KBW10 TaxID=2153357 RepID=UPI000F9862F2